MSRCSRIAIAALAALTAACSMDRKSGEEQEERRMQIVSLGQDNMIYGTLEGVVGQDSLRILTDGGDSVWVKLLDEEAMLGELITGSQVAVEPMGRTEPVARKVFNISMMLGGWVEPNPLAEGTYCGVQLLDGGAANSINSQTTNYEGWRLFDGRLLLVSTVMGLSGGEQSVDTFEVTRLTSDSLVLEGSLAKYYFCRKEFVKDEVRPGAYRDEDDRGGDYDLFNPEGDAPEGSEEDGLLY